MNGKEKEYKKSIYKYVPNRLAKDYFSVSSPTLRRWADTGKIEFIRTPSGQRKYCIGLLGRDQTSETGEKISNKIPVVYIRVSSYKQKDDLERQRNFMLSKYKEYKVVSDIGSGLNFKRRGLISLLQRAKEGLLSEVIVASRDRLCRFGFEILEYYFNTFDVKVVVLDDVDKSKEQELVDDLLSIVQVFCCRKNGSRRYIDKDEKNKTESNIQTEEITS
jgi:putative resolvase